MIRLLLFISFLSFTLGDSPNPIDCGLNEEFSTCGTCDPTCENPNPICTDECKVGCFCKNGYVRNGRGECILSKDCSRCYGENEEFIAGGTACEATCDDRNPICTLNIVSGCFCKKGFIRDKYNKCIPIEHCPINCGLNEVFSTCGTCDPTCEDPNPICTAECKVGCFCKNGYVRNGRGECILSKYCPRCYGENEEFIAGGTACEATCDDRNPICTLNIVSGCFCKKGFIRDKYNRCIPIEQCPKRCRGSNEETEECLTPGCTPSCRCKPGFVRRNGVCVRNYYQKSYRRRPHKH